MAVKSPKNDKKTLKNGEHQHPKMIFLSFSGRLNKVFWRCFLLMNSLEGTSLIYVLKMKIEYNRGFLPRKYIFNFFQIQNNARYYRHLLCYDAFWGLKIAFGQLWHLLGLVSHLIICQEIQKNVRYYRCVLRINIKITINFRATKIRKYSII